MPSLVVFKVIQKLSGLGAGLKRSFVNDFALGGDDGELPKKKQFTGPRKVLLITRIPSSLNNIMKMNEHFQKFGSINNIQVYLMMNS